jgi:hypothetical protein
LSCSSNSRRPKSSSSVLSKNPERCAKQPGVQAGPPRRSGKQSGETHSHKPKSVTTVTMNLPNHATHNNGDAQSSLGTSDFYRGKLREILGPNLPKFWKIQVFNQPWSVILTGSRPCNKPPKLCSPRHARSKRGRSIGAPSAYEYGFGLRPPLCRVPSDTAYHEEARLVADLNCRMRYPESRYSARSECSPRLPLVR